MSLDVYLDSAKKSGSGSGIFVRENGQTREITRAEWDEKFPGREPVIADVDAAGYSNNITHNLGQMADKAGVYQALWRPEEIGIQSAWQLIEPLRAGLKLLQADPEYFKTFNPANGWGNYEGLVSFIEDYLRACEECPSATVHVSR